MKKSLCIDARMWFSSGIGTYLRHLVSKLEERSEFEITLLVKKQMNSGLKEIKVSAPLYSLLTQRAFCRSIPKCDLFWSPHFNVPLLPIPAVKRAVTIHDVCHLAQKESFSWIKKRVAKSYLSAALKKSDLVLSVSSFSKEEILRCFPGCQKEIHVAHSGVPLKTEAFSDLTIQKPFILYVGNIRGHKNILRLLEAFKRFSSKEVDLILAGALGMRLSQLPHNIHVLENLSDAQIASLYRQAKLLIQPSLYEGFGFTPLEAMSYGCPVVAASIASLPEVCGDAAYYIDPLSLDSLYLGMKQVLEDRKLRESLVLKGYERIQNFSWDQSVEKISELFLGVL